MTGEIETLPGGPSVGALDHHGRTRVLPDTVDHLIAHGPQAAHTRRPRRGDPLHNLPGRTAVAGLEQEVEIEERTEEATVLVEEGDAAEGLGGLDLPLPAIPTVDGLPHLPTQIADPAGGGVDEEHVVVAATEGTRGRVRQAPPLGSVRGLSGRHLDAHESEEQEQSARKGRPTPRASLRRHPDPRGRGRVGGVAERMECSRCRLAGRPHAGSPWLDAASGAMPQGLSGGSRPCPRGAAPRPTRSARRSTLQR